MGNLCHEIVELVLLGLLVGSCTFYYCLELGRLQLRLGRLVLLLVMLDQHSRLSTLELQVILIIFHLSTAHHQEFPIVLLLFFFILELLREPSIHNLGLIRLFPRDFHNRFIVIIVVWVLVARLTYHDRVLHSNFIRRILLCLV